MKTVAGIILWLGVTVGIGHAASPTIYSYVETEANGSWVDTVVCVTGVSAACFGNHPELVDVTVYDSEALCEAAILTESGKELKWAVKRSQGEGGVFPKNRLNDVFIAAARATGEYDKAVKVHGLLKDAIIKTHEDFCRTHECAGF